MPRRPGRPPAAGRQGARRVGRLPRRPARHPAGHRRARVPHRGGPAAADSLLVLYTDGLVEARGRDFDQGLDRLARALRTPARSLAELCDDVLARMLPHPAQDDVAVLMARPQ
ncbi:serine/threonine-protein phosphatase [Streptomyces sp. Tue 6430]|nr:serine/threonine-protein phosphatase [Streptomyces sp. Tue 6430]